MQEARFWKKADKERNNTVQCKLCPHNCVITEGKTGLCGVRQNNGGKLFSLVYGRPVAVHVDPIEKKPLYHFFPGSLSLSIGTVGCNLFCQHCQNWDIARGKPDKVPSLSLSPEQVVKLALNKGCKSISYTYNEPTIYLEYAVDCARLARKNGLRNIIVTNGFISKEPAEEFTECMDAANVDLKSSNDEFYRNICKGKLSPVLDTLKIFKKNKNKLWLEVTNLIIDKKNDSMKEIENMCKWIGTELGKDVPLHFSRAFPMYKMLDIQPTPEKTLLKAKKIAEKYLDYVYVGNIELENSGNTFCPKCKKELISRNRYETVISPELEGNKCRCGSVVAGVF